MAKAAATEKRAVTFSNVEKILFPKTGFKKGDLIRYYLDVAPWILPHLRERAVTLIRFPDGVEGEKFYEKNAPRFTPAWVKTTAVARRERAGAVNYIVVNDAHTLGWCANLAAIEFHPFLHHASSLDQPTHVVLDLDPGEGADVLTCARVAFLVKEVMDGLGLQAFPKVSGSKGLQVYVPLNTKTTYAITGAFAKGVAELLEQRNPKLVVSKMTKALRRSRVLIDWSQNNRSKTTVAVYSMRGKNAEPFISMPVTWEELRRALRAKKKSGLYFSPAAALKRLRKNGDLFAPVLTLKQRLPAAFTSKVAETAAPQLQAYATKRDFSRTQEPGPAPTSSRARKRARGAAGGDVVTGRFVVQKHAASHLHYDFRLEMEGTLKSWAIPKGVPAELGVKRAAFEVEDHPIAYMKFEGTIPKGQYGGGTVMVWDLGTFELLGGSLAEGDLKLRLKGKKLIGEWHLFRIKEEKGKTVWLIAKSGVAAKPISARRDDMSVLTQRSMARIAKDNDAQWRSKAR